MFKCYDCEDTIKGKPELVIRHDDEGRQIRVHVCKACQTGIDTAEQRLIDRLKIRRTRTIGDFIYG